MKTIEEKIKESIPTLVLFEKAEAQEEVELKKLINGLKEQYGDKIHIFDYDCKHDGQLKVKYRFNEYPTWILFKEGQELQRESGHKTLGQLSDMVVRAL